MTHTRLVLPALIALATGTPPALGGDDHARARDLVEDGRIRPLEDILRDLPQRYRGRLLEAELGVEDGGPVYELEVLRADGSVWEINVDATTGELIEIERED